jgi:chemotaxis family two-component system response regulator Rcp1
VNTTTSEIVRSVQVLLVGDNPGDVWLTREALDDANAAIELHVTSDGLQAMAFLRREGAHVNAPRPDLILLDLRLPKLDGYEALALIKKDNSLEAIPIIVLTTSLGDLDTLSSYRLHASRYVTRPNSADDFKTLVKSINDFWLNRARLPGPVLAYH